MPAERSKKLHEGMQLTWAAPHEPMQASFAFAPNVTPGSYSDPTPDPDFVAPESVLFPDTPADAASPSTAFVSESGAGASSARKRSAHAKKKPDNHIPRPPNAFILFRSSFIKSQHVSTDVETNHSTLSKIIGLTWQNLPPAERNVWHAKAKAALDEHKRRWPQYAFKPLHTKSKEKAGDGGACGPKPERRAEKRRVKEVEPKDLVRCEKIAALLVEGKKGAELNAAVREFDAHHVRPEVVPRFEAPLTVRAYRRSSSVPALDAADHHSDAIVRSVSTGPARTDIKCESPVSDVPPATPITLEFNMDMFAPSAGSPYPQETFSFPAPTDTCFNLDSFTFKSTNGAPAHLAPLVDPLYTPTQQCFSPTSAPGSPMDNAGFDPSMPPLVERPYDPLTDHMPYHALPHTVHLPNPEGEGFPRLSINTLSFLESLAGHDPARSTPPPLSAVTIGEVDSASGSSIPGTPSEGGNWSWQASSPDHSAHQHQQHGMPSPGDLLAAFHQASQMYPPPSPSEYGMEHAYDAYDFSGCTSPTQAPSQCAQVPVAAQPVAATLTFNFGVDGAYDPSCGAKHPQTFAYSTFAAPLAVPAYAL